MHKKDFELDLLEDKENYNPYWETQEFEDLVARGLIGLYETKLKKDKKGPKCARFNEELFAKMRKRGCYFPARDRVVSVNFNDIGDLASNIQEIDMKNDGLPAYALWSSDPTGSSSNKSDYLWTFYMEKIPFLPSSFQKPRHGVIYRCMQVFFGEKVEGCGTFVVIDNDGFVETCFMPINYNDKITGKPMYLEHRPIMTDAKNSQAMDYYAVYASMGIQIFQDKKHLWNVCAKEGIAKATFSVYPEQIKSLFYSRDLPMTESGRKRPILHWVTAHQRRMKEGIDINIDKYLRGTNEFVFNNTKYEIINPLKVKLRNKQCHNH